MPMPTQEHHERKWDTYRLFGRLTSPPAPFPSAAWLKPWHESCGFLCMAHDFRVAWVDGQRAEASGGTKSVPLEPPYPSWILEADPHPRLLRGPSIHFFLAISSSQTSWHAMAPQSVLNVSHSGGPWVP